MNIILQRVVSGENGTYGVIIINNRPMFVSLELPWRDNQRNISCIPAGTYKAIRMVSPTFKREVLMLIDIPGRDAVEFHIGNELEDTRGCILVGLRFNLADYGVLSSTAAFDSFMLELPKDGITVTVKDTEDVKTTIPVSTKI